MKPALRLLVSGLLFVPFGGAFRRDVVKNSGLLIRPTYEQVNADVAWSLGLALSGRLRYLPKPYCRKRFYSDSTSSQRRWGHRHWISQWRVMLSYVDGIAPAAERVLARRVVTAWSLLACGARLPLPQKVSNRAC